MDYLDHDLDNYSTSVAPAAPDHLDVFRITMAILYLAVCTLGLTGNILVIVAILKLDKMASATTVYIFNLALADGLFMVSLPFVAMQNFRNQWEFGELVCKLVMVLDGVNQFTSVFCLTVMSVDRYMALVDPLRFAHWRTPRRAKVVSAVLWLFSLAPVLPMALHFSVQNGCCTLTPPLGSDPGLWWLAFISYTFLLGFLLPFTLMIVSYASLVSTMRSQRLRQRYRQVGASGTTSPGQESHCTLEKQVTKMVVAVVAVFGVCWIPFYAFNFYSVFAADLGATFARAFEFVVLLSYSWSCANPILYACFSDTFRCHFRTLLCPAKPSADVDRHGNAAVVTERYNLTDADGRDVSVVQATA